MKNTITRVFTLIFCLAGFALSAFPLYWVGDGGDWSDTAHWSFSSGGPGGASIPAIGDDAIFDANSFSLPGQEVVIGGTILITSMDWTGVTNNPSLVGSDAFEVVIDGSLTFSADMDHAFMGNYTFSSSIPGNTITSGGQQFLRDVIFNGTGDWTLQDAMQVDLAIQILEGTFISNNQNINVFTFFSNTQLTRNIQLGSSLVTINQRVTGSPSSLIAGGDNLTWDAGDASIEFQGTSSIMTLNGSTPFNFGSLTFSSQNSIVRSSTTTSPTIDELQFMFNAEIEGNLTIDRWTLTMGQTVFLSNGSRQVVTDIVTGDDCDGLASIIVRNNTGANATLEFTFSPSSLSGLFLKGIEADSPDGRTILLFASQDGGSNGNLWVFQDLPPRDLYWVGSTGDWNDRSNWASSSGGAGGECIPKPNDNIFFDNNSFTAPTDVVSGITPAFANNLTWDVSNFTTVEIRLPELYIINDLTLSTLVNWNIPDVYLVGNDEAGNSSNTDFQVINTGTNTLINLIMQSNRQVVLDADLILSGQLNLSTSLAGNTFDSNEFDITAQSFVAINNPISLLLERSRIIITGPRVGLAMPVTIGQINSIRVQDTFWEFLAEDSGIESDIGLLGGLNFLGETGLAIILSTGVIEATFVTFRGDGQMSGEEINSNVMFLAPGHSYTFDSDTRHNIGFQIAAPGTICLPINIMSNVNGVQATIETDALFDPDMQYVNIRDMAITGASQNPAGLGSADLGNNTGWTFPSDEENDGVQQFLGRDQVLCADEIETLQPFSTSEISRIVWANDGSETLIFQVDNSITEVIATAFFPDGCSLTDTVAFEFQPTFSVDLGQDSTICEGESLILDASIPGASYLWNNGDTTAQIIPDVSDDYVVNVVRGGCSDIDTVSISVIDIEDFDLGRDTTLCDNNPLILAAPAITNGTFTWSNGTDDSRLLVTTSSTVWVEVNQDRCSLRDSLTVVFDPNFELSIGNDTTICEGETIILTPIGGLDNYNWSDNSTDSLLAVNSSGTYTLQADRGVCSNTTSVDINVSLIEPFSIGQDLTRCEGDSVTIAMPVGLTLPSTWSDGTTTPTFNINSSGTYWLEVQEDKCIRRDSLEAIFETPFDLNLGVDTTLCNSETLTLSTPFSDGDFDWDNTSTDQTIEIDIPGSYILNLTRGACTVSDTIDVSYITLGSIDLGRDTTLCEGQELSLDASGIPNANIIWNDGNMDSIRVISTPGMYAVEVLVDRCSATDNINVLFDPAINLELGADQTACAGDTIRLDQSGLNADAYNWNTGSSENTLIVTTSNNYILTADRGACTAIDTVAITYLDLDALNLGDDRTSCIGESITFDGSLPGITNYEWIELNGGTSVGMDADIIINTDGTYVLSASSQGCSTEDTVIVMFDTPIPFSSLGSDTTLCQGDELNFDLSIPDVDVVWSDATTNPIFSINSPGTYRVDLERGGCRVSDTIEVQVRPLPMVSLVETERACDGAMVTLNANTANVSYNWSTGESSPMINVTTPGLYIVTLTDDQCMSADSTEVTFVSPPLVDLRPDTTVCDGTNLNLDPMVVATEGLTYRWSTGELSPTITADDAGMYRVTVSNNDNCSSVDSFALSVNQTPNFPLPDSTFACEGNTASLLVIVTSDDFVWSTGETSQSIDVATTSLVWAEASIGTCVFRDSTQVTIRPNPVFQLPGDTTICDGATLNLDAMVPNGTYLWSNGQTTPNITVTAPGNYDVVVTLDGCTSADALNLTINPLPTIELGSDQTICEGESVDLDASGAWTTTWSTGESTPQISVNQSGTISVIADLNGCTVEDQVSITVQPLPEFDLGEDISRCEQFATTLVVDRSDVDVLWSTGEIGRSIEVNDPGTYTATAMTAVGCTFIDEVTIVDRTCQRFSIYVPNAFSPESQGPNNFFYVSPSDNATIISYNINIFDRWGNLLFESQDINAQWDGRTPNFGIQPGVYTYAIEVRYSDDFETDRTDLMSGDFTVIR